MTLNIKGGLAPSFLLSSFLVLLVGASFVLLQLFQTWRDVNFPTKKGDIPPVSHLNRTDTVSNKIKTSSLAALDSECSQVPPSSENHGSSAAETSSSHQLEVKQPSGSLTSSIPQVSNQHNTTTLNDIHAAIGDNGAVQTVSYSASPSSTGGYSSIPTLATGVNAGASSVPRNTIQSSQTTPSGAISQSQGGYSSIPSGYSSIPSGNYSSLPPGVMPTPLSSEEKAFYANRWNTDPSLIHWQELVSQVGRDAANRAMIEGNMP